MAWRHIGEGNWGRRRGRGRRGVRRLWCVVLDGLLMGVRDHSRRYPCHHSDGVLQLLHVCHGGARAVLVPRAARAEVAAAGDADRDQAEDEHEDATDEPRAVAAVATAAAVGGGAADAPPPS